MTIPTSGEIPVFPGARHVDSKSVSTLGGGAHSGEWAVDAALAEVVAFYVERLGRPPETGPDGGSKWLFVEEEERPDGKSTSRTFVSLKAAPDGPCTLSIGGMSRFERSPDALRAKEGASKAATEIARRLERRRNGICGYGEIPGPNTQEGRPALAVRGGIVPWPTRAMLRRCGRPRSRSRSCSRSSASGPLPSGRSADSAIKTTCPMTPPKPWGFGVGGIRRCASRSRPPRSNASSEQ